MFSVDVELDLLPLCRGAAVQPFVVYDLFWIVERLADLISVFHIAEGQIETAEWFLTRLALIFA